MSFLLKYKGIILILIILLWIISTFVIIKILNDKGELSLELTNTYITFGHVEYNAPMGYLEYYMSKESGNFNKYTGATMTTFSNSISSY